MPSNLYKVEVGLVASAAIGRTAVNAIRKEVEGQWELPEVLAKAALVLCALELEKPS